MRPIAPSIALSFLLLAGCPPAQVPTPLVQLVQPTVQTVARTSGVVDVTGDCSQAMPAAPSSPAGPAGVRRVTVGHEIWRNTFSNCTTTRKDDYHPIWVYDLSGVGNLRGLVVRATVEIFPEGPTSGAPSPTCPGVSGGLGMIRAVPGDNPPVPSGTFMLVPPGGAWPAPGAVLAAIPATWSAGTLSNFVTTQRDPASGRVTYTIDLTKRVEFILNEQPPHTSVGLQLDGRMEAPLGAPAASSEDCRTQYVVGSLRLAHY